MPIIFRYSIELSLKIISVHLPYIVNLHYLISLYGLLVETSLTINFREFREQHRSVILQDEEFYPTVVVCWWFS